MQAIEIMNSEPIFCTSDMRIAEIKHLLKKYDSEELLVVDSISEKHPVGFVGLEDVSSWSVEHSLLPSDVSAVECMRSIPAVVEESSSADECLNVMRANHMERIPVVDRNGHVLGLLERSELVRLVM